MFSTIFRLGAPIILGSASVLSSPAYSQSTMRNGGAPADELRVPLDETRAIDAGETKLIQSAVREGLIDPTSPLFKLGPQITASKRYCGLVNGKNRFGGFTGFTSFSVQVSRDDHGRIIGVHNIQIATKASNEALMEVLGCLEDGYPVVMQGM